MSTSVNSQPLNLPTVSLPSSNFGDTFLNPWCWCGRQWIWMRHIEEGGACHKASQVALRMGAFFPLVVATLLAGVVGLIGATIKIISYRPDPEVTRVSHDASSQNTLTVHASSHRIEEREERKEDPLLEEAGQLVKNFLEVTTERTYYDDGKLYYRPRHSLSDIMKVGSVLALVGGYQSIEACVAKSYNGKAFSYLALIKRLDQAEEEYDLLLRKNNALSREPLVLCKPMGVCDRLSWEIDFPISERRVKQKIIIERIMEKLRVKATEWGCEAPVMPSNEELCASYGFLLRDVICGDMFILPHKLVEDHQLGDK